MAVASAGRESLVKHEASLEDPLREHARDQIGHRSDRFACAMDPAPLEA
jgi:hypothetical protein